MAQQKFSSLSDDLDEVIRLLPVAAFLMDERGRILFANERFRSMVAPPASEDMTVFNLLQIGRSDTQRHTIGDILAQNHDVLSVNADGKALHLHIRFSDAPLQSSQLYIGIVEDRTDQFTTLAGLRQSEDRLEAIFHSTPLGMCITDSKGYFETVNQAYCRLYGYTPQELIGRHFTIVVPESHKAKLAELHDRFIDEGAEIRGEWDVQRKDGSILTILADAVRIVGSDGSYKKVTFAMDITDKKRAERLKEDIEQITRHDIKSPLSGIMSLARFSKTQAGIPEDARRKFGMIEESCRKIFDLLNLSRGVYLMEQGEYTLDVSEVNLLSLLDQIVSDLHAETVARNIDLRIENETNQALIFYGEELLLYSMLSNLIRNAVEASPEGEKITVRVIPPQRRDETLRICIHNKGAIPESIRPVFFNKYVTYGKTGGTGLGTYSAMLIARSHGGTIRFETDDDRGTEVEVLLPTG